MTNPQHIRTQGRKTIHIAAPSWLNGCRRTLCDRFIARHECTTDPPTCPRCIRMAKAMEGRP